MKKIIYLFTLLLACNSFTLYAQKAEKNYEEHRAMVNNFWDTNEAQIVSIYQTYLNLNEIWLERLTQIDIDSLTASPFNHGSYITSDYRCYTLETEQIVLDEERIQIEEALNNAQSIGGYFVVGVRKDEHVVSELYHPSNWNEIDKGAGISSVGYDFDENLTVRMYTYNTDPKNDKQANAHYRESHLKLEDMIEVTIKSDLGECILYFNL